MNAVQRWRILFSLAEHQCPAFAEKNISGCQGLGQAIWSTKICYSSCSGFLLVGGCGKRRLTLRGGDGVARGVGGKSASTMNSDMELAVVVVALLSRGWTRGRGNCLRRGASGCNAGAAKGGAASVGTVLAGAAG